MTQTTPLKYSPFTGRSVVFTHDAAEVRERHCNEPWLFDPWTASRRFDEDIESDPTGLLIVPPGEEVRASIDDATPAEWSASAARALQVGDPHEAVTFHQLPAAPAAGIGDINSTAKGSGARYNTGKVPLELIPLRLIADTYLGENALHLTDAQFGAAWALRRLGEFQERADTAVLLQAIQHLGEGTWDEIAHVFDYGRKKYAEWNWAKGMAWSVPVACAARHLLAILRGEDIDPESGKPHRGHAGCNFVMLLTFARTYAEGDDRPAAGLLALEAA